MQKKAFDECNTISQRTAVTAASASLFLSSPVVYVSIYIYLFGSFALFGNLSITVSIFEIAVAVHAHK